MKDYVASEKFEGGKNPNTSTYKTIFHFSPTSWHYGWRSSKHKKDQRHCFRVVLLLPKKALKKALNAPVVKRKSCQGKVKFRNSPKISCRS